MTVLVTNESGADYRFSGHSNQKLFVAGTTMLLSDDEWDSVITAKRGPGQLNPQPLPISGSFSAQQAVYAVVLDDVGGTPYVTYVGEADPGTATSAASWRVKKLEETGPDVVITWADGNANFDNIWDNRASLSYS